MINLDLLKTLTALYVEDDILLRSILTRFLKRAFKQLYEAGNGKDGLDVYQEHKDAIDIVITDIEMPLMNGLVMIEKILEINPQENIIITTGYNDENHISQRACFNIIKPIDTEMLLQCVVDCINKRRLKA
jgi:YesN/AraC family two-component response regulator